MDEPRPTTLARFAKLAFWLRSDFTVRARELFPSFSWSKRAEREIRVPENRDLFQSQVKSQEPFRRTNLRGCAVFVIRPDDSVCAWMIDYAQDPAKIPDPFWRESFSDPMGKFPSLLLWGVKKHSSLSTGRAERLHGAAMRCFDALIALPGAHLGAVCCDARDAGDLQLQRAMEFIPEQFPKAHGPVEMGLLPTEAYDVEESLTHGPFALFISSTARALLASSESSALLSSLGVPDGCAKTKTGRKPRL